MSEQASTTKRDPRMVTESTLRTNSSMYNQGTRQKQLVHEIHNSAWNHRVITDAIAEGRARDLDDEPKHKLEPCFIIGSGPSLDESGPLLKDWPYGIICTTSHALTLMYYGVEPTHIVALDPFSLWDEIKGVDWAKTRTKLITQPGVWPDLVANWPGEMLLYIQNVGSNSFYHNTQRFMYTTREGLREATFRFLIRTEVTAFACSPACQMFCADRLGYGNIFLAGVDFAYHSNKERFTSYTVKTPERVMQTGNAPDVVIPAEWERHDHPYVSGPSIIMTNNGLASEQVHLYYLKNFISASRLSMQDIYSTDHGAMVQFPHVRPSTVIKKHGKEMRKVPPREKEETYDQYLCSLGAYVIETSAGKLFIECENPMVELPHVMNKINHSYTCPGCQQTVESTDDVDHTGEPCPACHAPVARPSTVDIEANMRRFTRLIEEDKRRREEAEREVEAVTA